jgi:transcriptional regulator with XRE-family HTH domain
MLWCDMATPILMHPRDAVPGDVGKAIRAARDVRGWSQSRLGKKAGVSREAIGRIENGHQVPGAQLLRVLMRPEVLGEFISIKGWEAFDEPHSPNRGYRAYAARITAGLSLAEVAAATTKISPASLSHFERNLASPRAIVGSRSDENDGVINDLYAQALGFADAADMCSYLTSDDPLKRLKQIAERFGRPMPPLARLPTARPITDEPAGRPIDA